MGLKKSQSDYLILKILSNTKIDELDVKGP